MRAPAVFPALAVVAGIAAGIRVPDVRPLALIVAAALVLLSAFAWRSGRERLLTASLIVGFCAAGVTFGAIASANATRSPLRAFFDDYARLPDARWPMPIEGRLRGDALPTAYGGSLLVDIERVRTRCGWMPAPGGARLAMNGTLAAAAMREWRGGRRVRMFASLRPPVAYRNPGVRDEAFALARRGIALVGSVKSASLLEVVERGSVAQEAAAAARAYVRDTIDAGLRGRPAAASIVTAILIGDRGSLDPVTTRRLQEAGTYHVIAISGGNIAILAGLGYMVLRLLRVPGRARPLTLAGLLCAYGYVAGGGPSVARATLAATVYLLAVAADHRSPSANVLACVALLAVVFEPLDVFDPGLALSYGATLALLLAGERAMAGHRRRDRGGDGGTEDPRRLSLTSVGLSVLSASRLILIATAAAELALFPVTAYVFNRVTVAGLVLNILAVPLMTVAQIAGLALLVVSPLSDALGGIAGRMAAAAATGLIESTRLLDYAPWLAWRVPSPWPWAAGAYYAGWICWLWLPVRSALKRAALAASAIAAAQMCVPALSHLARPGELRKADELRVTFLDVGQGDAVLLQLPGGRSMLIDAAGLQGGAFDLGERVITPALLARGVRRLDSLVITHGDPDHAAGAASIARDFRPRELWEGIAVPPHEGLRHLQAIVGERGGSVRTVRPDDRLRVGGVELRVLHPGEPDWERQRVRNDDSIVIEARYGDVSIVLPGDISASVEATLAARLSDAPLRILKAAHHGSATSSSAAWLEAARPTAVVFSCGRGNRYGHPNPAVLARVNATGAEIFRTDEDGAVTVTTDGRELEIATVGGRRTRLTTKTTRNTKSTKGDQYGSASQDYPAR